MIDARAARLGDSGPYWPPHIVVIGLAIAGLITVASWVFSALVTSVEVQNRTGVAVYWSAEGDRMGGHEYTKTPIGDGGIRRSGPMLGDTFRVRARDEAGRVLFCREYTTGALKESKYRIAIVAGSVECE